MIIGKNNNNFNSSFDQKFNAVKQNSEIKNNNFTKLNETTTTMAHTNINSFNDMNQKSFAMLQDRLNNGLISVEEFNKKCNELNKRKQI